MGSFPSRLKLQLMADAIGAPRAEILGLAGYEQPVAPKPSDDVALRQELDVLRATIAELDRQIQQIRRTQPEGT